MDEIFLRVLECPICLQTLRPPTHSCTAGHTLCNACYNQLKGDKSCPTCRGQIQGRNFVVEEILATIPQPCENKHLGCQQKFPLRELRTHQSEQCKWRKMNCPKCAGMVVKPDMKHHILTEHVQHIHNISSHAQFSLTITPRMEGEEWTRFLRDKPSGKILPYHVKLSVSFDTNLLGIGVCSWNQTETLCELSICRADTPSLNVRCSIQCIPFSCKRDFDWYEHEDTFVTDLRPLRISKEAPVIISVSLAAKRNPSNNASNNGTWLRYLCSNY